MSNNNFHYAISLAQTLYDVEGNLEDLEEIGLIAYEFIGNKQTRLYKTQVDCIDGVIQLPCNVDIIEAVTLVGHEDGNDYSNIHRNKNSELQYSEDYIETYKTNTNPLYISGEDVKYKQAGDKLYTNIKFGRVNLLYHGILLDEDGLPCLNDKEAVAIADYIAYTLKYKEALKTNNQNVMTIAKDIKKSWLIHCDAARVPEHLSQNELDTILDVKTSWGRKVYGRSYKPAL